jgi:hypothetical protein
MNVNYGDETRSALNDDENSISENSPSKVSVYTYGGGNIQTTLKICY